MANSTETRTPSSPRSGAEPDRSIRLPGRKRGATIAELPEATGWQPHPVRSATAAQLRALEHMDVAGLRAEWRTPYRSTPPKRVSRELLILGVAWKIQERVQGGFSAATKRRLAALTRSLAQDGDIRRARVTRPKPGSRLIREWGGRTHSVAVSEDGFEWNGKTWRSLSAIAREITGAHWSGPRFFGVTGRSPARAGAPVTGHGDD